jgi:hypothetical protein
MEGHVIEGDSLDVAAVLTFEIVPVVPSKETRQIITPHLQRPT